MIIDRVVYMRVLIVITPVIFQLLGLTIDSKLELTDHRVGYARK